VLNKFSIIVALVLTLLAAACAPQTAAERAYFEQKAAEKQELRELKSKLNDTTLKDSDIIGIVSSNAAPDGIGTIDDWLKRKVGEAEGQVLFPRWKVMRHGSTKFEVQHTFNVIDPQNRIIKRGYQWQVDTVVKLVGNPRDLVFAEQQATAETPAADLKQQRRTAGFEASLE
jgi:hypothetical protein